MTNAPVTDPTVDYDIFDAGFVVDPYPTMSEIRESGCPVAHSDRWGGSWMPTRYEDVIAVAQEYDVFSSSSVLVTAIPVATEGPYANVKAPPISSDMPDHHWHRRAILPTFAPQSVAPYEAVTRAWCHELIDRFIDSGTADAAADYAQQIPVRIISLMLGVSTDMADTFTGWVSGLLGVGLTDPVIRKKNRDELMAFLAAQVADRRGNPREHDFITTLLEVEHDGVKVDDDYVMGVCNLMIVAGVDTTWSSIGSGLWHMAQHPEHRAQLRERPELWPQAVEELLRAYSPVTMARVANHDTEFQGCPMQGGDRVLLSFPAANRDPRQFPNPDVVDFEREHNRHVAFGAGIHRCAGSNLARLELRVALQVFLERIPEFELVDPASVTWMGGQVRGPRVAMVRFPRPA